MSSVQFSSGMLQAGVGNGDLESLRLVGWCHGAVKKPECHANCCNMILTWQLVRVLCDFGKQSSNVFDISDMF